MNRILILGAVGIVAIALLWVLRLDPAVSQPIAFDHFLHVDEVGAECLDCHSHAQTGAIATIPNIEICAECHEEPQTESLAEMQVVNHIQEGTPIPWRKIYGVPDDVYFSHRRHTVLANIECVTCHGEIGAMTQPIERPLVRQSMNWCIQCHVRSGVTKDCVSCHR